MFINLCSLIIFLVIYNNYLIYNVTAPAYPEGYILGVSSKEIFYLIQQKESFSSTFHNFEPKRVGNDNVIYDQFNRVQYMECVLQNFNAIITNIINTHVEHPSLRDQFRINDHNIQGLIYMGMKTIEEGRNIINKGVPENNNNREDFSDFKNEDLMDIFSITFENFKLITVLDNGLLKDTFDRDAYKQHVIYYFDDLITSIKSMRNELIKNKMSYKINDDTIQGLIYKEIIRRVEDSDLENRDELNTYIKRMNDAYEFEFSQPNINIPRETLAPTRGEGSSRSRPSRWNT